MSEILPNNWIKTTVGDVSNRITKGSTPTSYGFSYKDDGIKFIKTENVDQNGNIHNIKTYIDEETNKFLKRSILKKNDILFSIAGTIGRVGIVKENDLPANTNQALAIIRSSWDIIDVKYLFYLLRSNYAQRQASGSIVGVGRANVSLTNISEFKIPIPPLQEQHRIIAKLEELFTKLDAGVKSLKQAQAQLKRYRQSVLKAAVEGGLTAEWREQGKNEYEPADKLLERILKERRKNWEVEQLAKYESKSKKPLKNWQDKYKEPTPPDTINLHELPDAWNWVTIDQISFLISGQHIITKKYNQEGKGIPYLTGPADFGAKFPITSKWTEFPKAISIKDDVLITVKGAGVGKINILNLDKSAISRQLMAIRSDYIKPDFIFYYFQLMFDYFQRIGQGSTVPGINRETILSTPLPFPTFREQMQIVIELDKFLSIIEESEIIIKSELKRSYFLRQSILKHAFEGKLVPQDPNDLPASVLLEKIKSEKAKSKKSKQMEIL